jgi:hypothetical protein
MPATPIINARTNSSGLLDFSSFIFCAGINQTALLPVGDDIDAIRRSNPQKKLKKIRKKACQGFGPSAREECRATNALISSFKKKSKK